MTSLKSKFQRGKVDVLLTIKDNIEARRRVILIFRFSKLYRVDKISCEGNQEGEITS